MMTKEGSTKIVNFNTPMAEGVMKFTILVDLSVVIITKYLVVRSMPGSREEDF